MQQLAGPVMALGSSIEWTEATWGVTDLVHRAKLLTVTRASTAFGVRLRLLREQRRVTMKGLARQIGVDPSFLSRIERGIVAAPAQLVRELSKALGAVADPLLVLAGHLPEDVEAILLEHPERSLALLREQLGSKRRSPRQVPAATNGRGA
jgi:transcriptional regulator with XRE-family HTH domain